MANASDNLTPAQAADFLENQITSRTICNWINVGLDGHKLPAIRLGPRRILINRNDLIKFLGEIQPHTEAVGGEGATQ